MRSLALITLLAGFLTAANCPGRAPDERKAAAAQAAPADPIPAAERVWIASKMYASVQTYFAHWQAVPRLDLDACYKKYLEAVLADGDRMTFDLASMEFLAQLRNGHTRFNDRWLRETHGQPLGFFLTRLDGRWIVTDTRIQDLTLGTVVRAIDGVSVDDFFARKQKYIAASNEMAQQRALFYMPYLFPATFSLTLDDGGEIRIARKEQKLKSPPPRAVETRVLAAEVGYLRIPSFAKSEDEEKAIAFVKQLESAKCLIIDVRGNGGGSTPGRLTRALMDRPYPQWAVASPLSVGMFGAVNYFERSQVLASFPVQQPAKPVYTGPLLILTDADTASAAEDFVMPFKVTGRARVVGQTTHGSTGQPYVYDFGNGMWFFVSSKRVFFPDGSPFKGVGITPDVKVEPVLQE
jgi:carboxyl-terminal processing protease